MMFGEEGVRPSLVTDVEIDEGATILVECGNCGQTALRLGSRQRCFTCNMCGATTLLVAKYTVYKFKVILEENS